MDRNEMEGGPQYLKKESLIPCCD